MTSIINIWINSILITKQEILMLQKNCLMLLIIRNFSYAQKT